MDRKTYDRKTVTLIAERHGLGPVAFVNKIALNSGNPMEVGYVRSKDGGRDLFCKNTSSMFPGDFYLCNAYEGLT